MHRIRATVLPLFGLVLSAACAPAPVSMFVPTLELRLSAVQRTRGLHAHERRQGGSDAWSATGWVWLSFRAHEAASAPLTRAASQDLFALAPCDETDDLCLQETAEAEAELASALAELP